MKATCTLTRKSVDEETASIKTMFFGYVACIVLCMNNSVSDERAASTITVVYNTTRPHIPDDHCVECTVLDSIRFANLGFVSEVEISVA